MKPLISCLIGLVILGCADKDSGLPRGQYIQTDKTLPSRLTLKLKIRDTYGNLVRDIEVFKGEKKHRYLVKKPITPGVYSYELESNKFLVAGTISMEAGDTDLKDTCLKDAKRKQLGVRASAQKEIEQIDNALALADDMTARIEAVSAAANDAVKNCFVYNSDSGRYYREKRQSGIAHAWIVTDPEYIRLVDADIKIELSKRRAKK